MACPPQFAEALRRHNEYRARHGAAPLSWSPELAASAQSWANKRVFKHSHYAGVGENLGLGHRDTAAAVDSFYSEIKHYDWRNPGFSMTTGHFTQVVWLDTTHLGIGISDVNGRPLYVFQYGPPGNVMGEFGHQVPQLLRAA